MQQLLLDDPWIDVNVELRTGRSGSYGNGFMDRAVLALTGPLIDVCVDVYPDGMAVVDTVNRPATTASQCHDVLIMAVLRSVYWAVKDFGYQSDIVLGAADYYVRVTFDNGVKVDIKWNRDKNKLMHYGSWNEGRVDTEFTTLKDVKDFIFDYKDY